jgi:hypothetical protein
MFLKSEEPDLAVTRLSEQEPLTYRCTSCNQMFVFPADTSAKEGAIQLWAAFDEHVRDAHGVNQWRGDYDGTEGSR